MLTIINYNFLFSEISVDCTIKQVYNIHLISRGEKW